jgi:hypothetical protein
MVRNYSSTKHHACAGQLRHDRLNHAFELAGVNYLPWLEPIAHGLKKRKASGVEITSLVLKKIGGMKRWRKASSRTSDKTSEQKVLLVKPLKLSKKSIAKGAEAHSSGLSIGEKALFVKTSFIKGAEAHPWSLKLARRRCLRPPIEKDESGYVSTRVVDLLDSLASEVELTP